MKKITLSNPEAEVIKFLVRGQRGSVDAVDLEIDAAGVIVSDADAAIVIERLGGNVDVVDVDAQVVATDMIETMPSDVSDDTTMAEPTSDT